MGVIGRRHPRGKALWYPFDGKLGGPQADLDTETRRKPFAPAGDRTLV
jgi:hypothetical protein